MRGYNGDASFKSAFLAEIEKHRQADQIIAGEYGKLGYDGIWRGCAVGCSLHSLNALGRYSEHLWGDHGALADALGIPLVLVQLEDRLFEGMSTERRPEWPGRFASAIAPWADLSGVWTRFARWMLMDGKQGVIRFAKDRSHEAISSVESLYSRRQSGDHPSRAEWIAAAYAAADAANSAYTDYAAYAAHDAAYAAANAAHAATAAAASAAYAAADAANATYAATAAADAAANAVDAADAANSARARRAHFDAMADKLIELMQECEPEVVG